MYSARHRLGALARRAAGRLGEQRGQDLIEYGGVLAIIALIIGAIFATGFWTTVKDTVTNTINNILSGHGNNATSSG